MKKSFVYSLAASAVLLALNASAQDSATEQLDTIDVVTSGTMYKMGEVPFHQAKSAVAINRETLDRQNVTKADELGRYQAGFTNQVFGTDTNTNWFRVRGTEVTQAVDGLPTFSYGFFTPYVETFGLEAVEVTKGADAITFGAANSGGLINYVSKRAHKDQIGKGEFKVTMGSGNQYGFGADYTGAFGSNENLRYRMVSSYNAKDGVAYGTYNRTLYIAPSLEWDISERTRLSILTAYQRDSGVPSSNFLPQEGTLKSFPNGRYLAHSTNLGDPQNDTETNRQYNLGYEFSHDFGNGLAFNSSYRYTDVDNYHRGSYAYPHAYDANWAALAPSAANYTVNRGVVFNDGTAKTHSVDNRLSWNYKNDWLDNTVVVGADYRHQKVDALYTLFGTTSAVNILEPTSGYHQTQDVSSAPRTNIKARQLGFYIQNNARLVEKFVVGFGVRHDRAQNDEYTRAQSVKKNHTSYSASFMYEAPFGINPYFSYSEAFRLPVGLSGNDVLYDPNITKQYEVGVKYLPTWLDATISLAAFKAKDKGALLSKDNGATISNPDIVRREGVELQLDAMLTKNWSATLAYTYLKSVTQATDGEVRNPLIPKQTVAARSTYSFDQGLLNGLMVGAGVRYLGNSVTAKNYSLYSSARVPSATLVDLMARYEINPNWALQLNAENIGNRRYISGCDTYCYYGEGRKFTANLSFKF